MPPVWRARRTVDGVVHPLVDTVDLRAKRLRVEVDRSLVRGQLVVERSVEHADDLRALVVHDRRRLLVPQYGHGEPPLVLRVHAQVQVLDVLRAEEGVRVGAGERVHVREGPAVRAHAR